MDHQPVVDPEPSVQHLSLRGWAVILAVVAVGLDGIAVITGESSGGRGWVLAAPAVWGAALAALAFVVTSACCSVAVLFRSRGQDPLAWFMLAVISLAACWAVMLIGYSGAAVAAV